MNNEIKEIKEELAKISFSNIGHCVNTNLILDYITNLQEENNRLNNIIKELTQENLKRSDKIDELLEIKNKAIDYIEEHNIIGTNKEYLPSGIEKCYSLELMEILKGDSSNE